MSKSAGSSGRRPLTACGIAKTLPEDLSYMLPWGKAPDGAALQALDSTDPLVDLSQLVSAGVTPRSYALSRRAREQIAASPCRGARWRVAGSNTQALIKRLRAGFLDGLLFNRVTCDPRLPNISLRR